MATHKAMEEQLISFETAKLAKEKGFNIETKHWYDQTETLNPIRGIRGSMMYENVGYAPTQSFLQKWLRDIKILVEVYPVDSWSEWHWRLTIEDCMAPFAEVSSGGINGEYKTYEEALECGLLQGLNFVSIK